MHGMDPQGIQKTAQLLSKPFVVAWKTVSGWFKNRSVRKVAPEDVQNSNPIQKQKVFSDNKNPFITVAPTTVEPKHNTSKPEAESPERNSATKEEKNKKTSVNIDHASKHSPDEFIDEGDLELLFNPNKTRAAEAWTVDLDGNAQDETRKVILTSPPRQNLEGPFHASQSREPINKRESGITFEPKKNYSASEIENAIHNDLVATALPPSAYREQAAEVLVNLLLVHFYPEAPLEPKTLQLEINTLEGEIKTLENESQQLSENIKRNDKTIESTREETNSIKENKTHTKDPEVHIAKNEKTIKDATETNSKLKIELEENKKTTDEKEKTLKNLKDQLDIASKALHKTGYKFEVKNHESNPSVRKLSLPEKTSDETLNKKMEKDFLYHLQTTASKVKEMISSNNSNAILSALKENSDLSVEEINKIEKAFNTLKNTTDAKKATTDSTHQKPLNSSTNLDKLTEQQEETLNQIDALHKYCYENIPGTKHPDEKNDLTDLMLNSLLVAEGIAEWGNDALGNETIATVHIKPDAHKRLKHSMVSAKHTLNLHYKSLSQTGSGLSFSDSLKKSGFSEKTLSAISDKYNKLMNTLTGENQVTTDNEGLEEELIQAHTPKNYSKSAASKHKEKQEKAFKERNARREALANSSPAKPSNEKPVNLKETTKHNSNKKAAAKKTITREEREKKIEGQKIAREEARKKAKEKHQNKTDNSKQLTLQQQQRRQEKEKQKNATTIKENLETLNSNAKAGLKKPKPSDDSKPTTNKQPLMEEKRYDDTFELNKQFAEDTQEEQTVQPKKTTSMKAENKPPKKTSYSYNDFSCEGIKSSLIKFASNEFEINEEWAIKALTEIVVMNRKDKQHEVNSINELIQKLIDDPKNKTDQESALVLAAAKKEIERLTETSNRQIERPNITLQHLSGVLARS